MQSRNSKPSITGVILVLNLISFLFLEWKGSTEDLSFMIERGALYLPLLLERGEYYRLVTSMFLHFGIEHLLNNMLVLFLLGEKLERALGKLTYALFYLFCGIGANLFSLFYDLGRGNLTSVSAGASGAIFGIVGGLFYAVLRNHGRLEDLSTHQLLVLLLVTLYHGVTNAGVNQAAHIGGLLCGVFLGILCYRKPKRDRDSGF